jgi:hypothetical protein
MIILAKDTSAVNLDVGAEAICVRHRSYAPPSTNAGCLHLDYEEFATDHKHALSGRSVMVIVGLSRIASPGNRTKVGPLLWGPIQGVRRISVDRTLFVAEPWRAWWHFGAVGARYREYTYSYLAESHWRAAQEGVREDPFTIGAIAECGAGIITSHYGKFFDPLDIETVQLPQDAHAEYQELKAATFDEEHTAKAIIARLAEFAQKACPQRCLPTTARLFSKDSHRIVMTDLAVDEFLVGQLRDLVALTDAVGARFHNGR